MDLFCTNQEEDTTMDSDYDAATMDHLLTRDWFVEDEDIEYVLDSASPEAWTWVYNNRAKYSTRIRLQIEPNDYQIPREKLRVKVVDLTDKMWEKLKSDRYKKLDAEFEKDWVKHSENVPDRPYNSLDTDLDDAWAKFAAAKENLEKYLEKPSKKYNSPSSRATSFASFKQIELEDKIRDSENEYLATQKLVDAEDELYWNKQKDEYLKVWEPIM
jgi:hypothetical protein